MKAIGLVLLTAVLLSGCGDGVVEQANKMSFVTKSGIEMIRIPAGSFQMGNNAGKEDERSEHTVTLDAFLMDRTEVTQEQYTAMKLSDPSHFKNPKNPVEQVSLWQAAQYCNARSKAEGLAPCYNLDTGECNFAADGYRLPTEAEWEYACRAGSSNDAIGLADSAWYADNSNKKTHPVGEKRPNAWGLSDMRGNVAEWCNDIYEKDYYKKSPSTNPHGPTEGIKYVLRGGSWDLHAESMGMTARFSKKPGVDDACFADDAIGFRCVRKAP